MLHIGSCVDVWPCCPVLAGFATEVATAKPTLPELSPCDLASVSPSNEIL